MDEPVLIHLHVPKCAGGAVYEVMRKRFGKGVVRLSGGHADATLSQMDTGALDAVTGHILWGVHRHFARRCLYFSAVREPVARICSYFNFLHTQPRTRLHTKIKTALTDLDDLEPSLFRRIPALRMRWRNAMCRAYTGIVGVSEMEWEDVWPIIEARLADGTLVVRDLAGITAFLEERGVHEGPLPKQKVTELDAFDDYVPALPETLKPATVDRVRALNQLDVRLMDALRETGRIAA